MRRYFPDFWVEVINKDGERNRIIIEIKPDVQTRKPRRKDRQKIETWIKNQDKWKAADQWAKKHRLGLQGFDRI